VDFEPPEPTGFPYVASQNFLNLVKVIPNTANSNNVTPKQLTKKLEEGYLKHGAPPFLWQLTHTVYGGPVGGPHEDKERYTTPPKLLCNFYSTYLI